MPAVTGNWRIQQVKMPSGEMMWAVALASDISGQSNKVQYKIVCPVVPGAPPPVLFKSLPPAPAPVRHLRPAQRPALRTVLRPALRPVPPPVKRPMAPPVSRLKPVSTPPFKPLILRHQTQQPSSVIRTKPPFNGTTDHEYGVANQRNRVSHTEHSYQKSKEKEMDDEIEEIDPLDPLALDDSEDPLSGLDPYSNDEGEVTIVS